MPRCKPFCSVNPRSLGMTKKVAPHSRSTELKLSFIHDFTADDGHYHVEVFIDDGEVGAF